MLNVKKTLTKLLRGFVEVRSEVIVISHGAIAGNAYGTVSFNPGSRTGESIISMTPISKDPAFQLTCYYGNGWALAYYNAYSGQASAGTFEVRVTHIKVGG